MGVELTDRSAGSQKQSVTRVIWDAALVGLGHADAAARLTERLESPVEWSELRRESRAGRLTPLVYTGLGYALRSGAKVPGEILQGFRCDTIAIGIRLARLEEAVTEIVERTTRAGIPALVLKGLALAATVYPPGIPRPMDDIDLLVWEADRERLAEILRARGFRNDLRGEEDFFPPSREFSVDVHTAPVNVTRIPARRALWPVTFEELWGRRQAFAVSGSCLHTLGPLDTICHLAVHAVHHHGLAGSLWLADLLQCFRKWSSAMNDLALVPPSARRSLWYCLETMTFRDVPFPDLQDRARPPWLYPGERRLVALASRGTLPETVRYAFTFYCLTGWRHKLDYLRQVLFPHPDAFRTGFSDAGSKKTGWATIWRMGLRLMRTLALHLMNRPTPSLTRHSASLQDQRRPGLDAWTTRADMRNADTERASLRP